MVISYFPTHPAAFIFLNNDISDGTKAIFQTQLYITEIISLAEFSARVAADSSYISNAKLNNQRVLIVDDALNYENRELVDIALYYRAGLVAVEKNNFGPHGITFALGYLTLAKLIIQKDF